MVLSASNEFEYVDGNIMNRSLIITEDNPSGPPQNPGASRVVIANNVNNQPAPSPAPVVVTGNTTTTLPPPISPPSSVGPNTVVAPTTAPLPTITLALTTSGTTSGINTNQVNQMQSKINQLESILGQLGINLNQLENEQNNFQTVLNQLGISQNEYQNIVNNIRNKQQNITNNQQTIYRNQVQTLLNRAIIVKDYLPEGVLPENATEDQVNTAEISYRNRDLKVSIFNKDNISSITNTEGFLNIEDQFRNNYAGNTNRDFQNFKKMCNNFEVEDLNSSRILSDCNKCLPHGFERQFYTTY